MADGENVRVLRMKAPTAMSYINLVNQELVKRIRLQKSARVILPSLLTRADQVINETAPVSFTRNEESS